MRVEAVHGNTTSSPNSRSMRIEWAIRTAGELDFSRLAFAAPENRFAAPVCRLPARMSLRSDSPRQCELMARIALGLGDGDETLKTCKRESPLNAVAEARVAKGRYVNRFMYGGRLLRF